jgi:hypothetical protein
LPAKFSLAFGTGEISKPCCTGFEEIASSLFPAYETPQTITIAETANAKDSERTIGRPSCCGETARLARNRRLIGAAWAVVASCQRVLFTDFGS